VSVPTETQAANIAFLPESAIRLTGMNEFMVTWDDGKKIKLQTREAALILKNSFAEEGREAKVYARHSPATAWMEVG
jgi:hypothetical protein